MTRAKRILWISRHKPLPIQLETLREHFGKIEIIHYDEKLNTIGELFNLVKKHNPHYIVAILPMTYLIRLIEKSKANNSKYKLLYAKMTHLHNCDGRCGEYNEKTDVLVKTWTKNGETFYRHYRFDSFYILRDIILDLVKL